MKRMEIEEKLSKLAEMVRNRLHELPQLENYPEEIDKFTERLTEIIQSSIKIVNKKLSRFKATVW